MIFRRKHQHALARLLLVPRLVEQVAPARLLYYAHRLSFLRHGTLTSVLGLFDQKPLLLLMLHLRWRVNDLLADVVAGDTVMF